MLKHKQSVDLYRWVRFLAIVASFTTLVRAEHEVEFSVERGFFTAPFQVELSSSDPNAQIRYTENYNKPTSSSTLYTGPINVSSFKAIRAIAISPTNTSKAVTHSYIFPSQVWNQSGMSSHVADSSRYSSRLVPSLLAIPSISIVEDSITPSEFIDVMTEISAEMIFPDGRKGWMEQVGGKSWGGSPTNPKRQYRFEFKQEFGTGKLSFPGLFDDGVTNAIPSATKFDHLLLRSGSQDSLNAEYGNEPYASFIRNRVCFDMEMEMGNAAPHGRFVHVYVNGQYRGQYHLMERPNAGWAEEYYEGDKLDFDMRKSGEYLDGNSTFYNDMFNVVGNNVYNGSSGYTTIKRYLDTERLAEYLVLGAYTGTDDSSQNHNSYAFANRTPGKGGYQFMFWDKDPSLANPMSFGYNGTIRIKWMAAPSDINASSEFKFQMADATHTALIDQNGPLTVQRARDFWNKRSDQVRLSLVAESARWGNYTFTGNNNSNVSNWNVDDDWEPEITRVRNWMGGHTQDVINYLKNNGYYTNLDGVTYSIPYGSLVPQGTVLNLFNQNGGGTVYYARNGDPRAYGNAFSSQRVQSSSVTLTGGAQEILGRVYSSGNWSAGTPQRYYLEQDWQNVVVNEIHYNAPLSCGGIEAGDAEFIELHNRGNSSVDLSHCAFSDGILYRFPFGTSIPANGYLVLAEDAAVFQAAHGFAPDGQYAGGLDNGGETLRLVNPVGGLISETTYNDKGDWPRSPDGDGPSLELRDAFADPSNPMNWFASADTCGSPRASNSVNCPANPIVINEIMYRPEDNKPGSLDSGEWIEIYNPGNSTINLSGWSFYHDGVSYPFPSGASIAPGGYKVAVSNSSTFVSAHPGGGFYYQIAGLRLDNGGGRLELRSAANCPADVLRYGDSAPWPSGPDGPGPSLSLRAPNLDNSLAASWADSGNIGGTPGGPNFPNGLTPCANPPADIVISEINYNGPGDDWFELYNAGNSSINLGGWAIATDARVSALPSTTIAAGGTKVFCRNSTSFGNTYPGVSRTLLSSLQLANSGDRLLLLSPGRCEADYVKFDDMLPWPGTADGSGDTITLLDPATDNELAWNWSGESPSPGQVVVQPPCNPAPPAIVINELNIDSSPFADVGDWIELYNNSPNAVNLGGWKFYDQNGVFTFPGSIFIGAGEYLVVAEDIFAFQAQFPAMPNVINGSGFTLSGGGEPIALLDGNCVVDALVYDNQVPWPTFGLGAGSSISLKQVSLDNADGANWFTAAEGMGTPGQTNTAFNCFDPVPALVIDAYAGIGVAGDWLRLRNNSGGTVNLEGYQVGDSSTIMFLSNLVLNANQTIVLASEPNNYAAANPGVNFIELDFNINSTNEQLTVYNRTHCIVDQVNTAGGSLNHVPQFFGPLQATVNETGSFSFNLSVVDSDAGQSLAYGVLSGAPAGLAVSSSGRLTWNPGEPDGPGVFDVFVTAQDNGSPQGVVTQRIELTVLEVNAAPTLSAPSQVSLPELSTWTRNLNPQDQDLPAQTLATTLISGPPGLVLNNGTLQWTPTEAQGPGTYSAVVEVTDGIDTVQRTITLNVSEVNDPPVFANPTVTILAAERDLVLWQAMAVDNDSPSPVYSLDANAPAGMVIDPVSGNLRWIPTEADGDTTVSFVVTATDSAGDSADQTVNVFVSERPDAPAGLSCTNLETVVTKGSFWAWSQDESGSAWKEPWVDVSAWSVDAAKFGWGESDDITQLPNNRVRTVFIQTFTVANVASVNSLILNLRRDDGAIVYLNGEEVARDNLPGGIINENTLASSSVFGGAEQQFVPHSLDISKLAEGINVLSIGVHQVAQNSNDMGFDAELVVGRLASCTPLTLDVNLYETTRLLGWDTDPGRTYVLEHCDDLRIGNWNVITNVTASGTRIEMPDPTGAPVGRRCYRVRVQ